MARFLFSVLFLIFSLTCFSQSKLGNWKQYMNNTKFGSGAWRLQFDLLHRDHNLFGDFDQIIIRPGIQYFHNESKSSYLAGYAFFFFQNEGDPNVSATEHRLFQDIDLRQGIGRLAIRHRYRFEERFVESQPFAFRLRYAVFVNIPLNHKEIQARTFYIPLWNEVFINAKGSPFDRDWLYAGLGYQIVENFGIQLGAMNQFQVSGPKAQLVFSLHHNMRFSDSE
tara:strand:- start:69 stop:740 length:672 start_codon:yes stop_codon:yes gene_type:complete